MSHDYHHDLNDGCAITQKSEVIAIFGTYFWEVSVLFGKSLSSVEDSLHALFKCWRHRDNGHIFVNLTAPSSRYRADGPASARFQFGSFNHRRGFILSQLTPYAKIISLAPPD